MITEKYDNFIWDFDGTLFDSYPHTAAALVRVLKESGKQADLCEAEKLLRITVGTAVRHYGLSDSEYTQFYVYENTDELEPTVKIYAGALQGLKRILARGGRHFLFTHRDKKAVELIEKQGITELFTEIITIERGFPYKPAPDAIQYLLEKYSLDKQKTVMVGDREIDIGSGINAGIHTLLFDEFGVMPETAAEDTFTSYEQIG